MTKLERNITTVLAGIARDAFMAQAEGAGRTRSAEVHYAVGQAELIARVANLDNSRYCPALVAYIMGSVGDTALTKTLSLP